MDKNIYHTATVQSTLKYTPVQSVSPQNTLCPVWITKLILDLKAVLLEYFDPIFEYGMQCIQSRIEILMKSFFLVI